ncbi:carbon monoxide dehydrogenase [Seongchinamella sediminis]|uniref:Carbon monoxide dehydrogenase n=1 Tax=Seongchinamella sediminis TaxID=2283635 RepID=A0A3L7DU09_9GAMM|nr:SRPBCC family protein [Seongchinamella sediminis]RLQ21077.1 carbon monoxide dehydrogenase [Seongchinamella sediminis]
MAIELKEVFQVAAPIDEVWKFLMDPERMIVCLPGATVTEIINDKQFIGSVKLKIGAITAKYAGTITYTTADQSTYTCVMLAEAKEKGGGTVSGTITTVLVEKEGVVEATVESCIDMTGRVVQVGRGMIEGVAAEIIGKFVKNIKKTLEVPAAGEGTAPGEAPQAPPAFQREEKEESINVLAVVFKVIWQGFVNFFKRLFGRGK